MRCNGLVDATACSEYRRMATPAERRALFFAAAICLLGVGARMVRARDTRPAPGDAAVRALDAQIARVDSARKAGRSGARVSGSVGRGRGRATSGSSSPPKSSSTPPKPILVDVDVADVAAIEKLPWIGPALAARIVENRDKCGPFGSPDALTRVYGIGPGTVKRLAPYVTFSGRSSPTGAARIPGCQRGPGA